MFKLLSRKLLGVRGRSILKAVLIASVIGGSLKTMNVILPIAQTILILFAIFYSGPIVLQTLSSKDNARCLKGLFAMPCNERKTLWEYAAVIALYTLFTKTILLMALIIAFTELQIVDYVILLAASFYSIIGSMLVYGFRKKAPVISAVVIAGAIALSLLLPDGLPAVIVLAAADVVLLIVFSFLKLDYFRVTEASGKSVKKAKVRRASFLIPRYIIRYMVANKSYIYSPLFIIAFGVFFTYNANTSGFPAGIGLALALVSVNSPIAILVSSNKNLKSKLDSLPDRIQNFFVPYAFVVFFFYMMLYAIFLTACFIIIKNVDYKALILSPIFAVQCAAAVGILESRFPITTWKTETDLLRHPRKYILPLILATEASLVYFLPF